MNILIVDDDPTSLKLLRAQLESEGHAVFEAHDGVDALALLERQRVDAVISDILMPRMDGYSLCSKIRKHARLHDLPIIIYSSTYTSPGDQKLALDMGADKYLKKPVSVETLVAALHEVGAQPHAAPGPDALREVEVLKEYNERLVSKLKEKNTELMAAEVKFRTLVEQSIAGIYIIQDDQFVYVNPRMVEIFGRSEEEMTSRMVYDFLVPEDQALARENIRKRISGGVPSVHYYARMLHQSGAVLQVEVHDSRADYNGRPAVMGTLLDITERKRSEEALRLQSAALNAAADAIAITDRAGVIEWINPAFTEITGYSTEEALGMHHRDLVNSGKHTRAFFKELWEAILAGRPWRGEIINRRKDRSLYTGEKVVTPLLNAAGVITHFVEIQQDITERVATEGQLRQSQKMEAVGQLTGGIAHDFNNILMVILANADELQEDKNLDAATLAERIERITEAVLRASALTRQLLAFTRKQPLDPKRSDLNDLVGDTGKLLRRALGEQIEIDAVLPDGLWAINIDRAQLEAALVNLSVNARDAMPKGGKLSIETRNVSLNKDNITEAADVAPGDYVMLSVTDTGSGMPPETVAKVFEPFFTTKEVGKGTGLGLSMVYGFVKQSHGHITVHSEVGHGTTFRLYLPRSDGVEEEVAVRPTAALPRGSERILVVEDEPQVRASVVRQLQSLGYIVSEAAHGQEAIAVFEAARLPFDLLLTDVVMPGPLSGRALADEVARRWPATKIVFVSGYAENALLHDGKAGEGVVLLSKPFRKGDLARTLRGALDGTSDPPAELPNAA